MGKLLCTEDEEHYNIHPGCMSGVFPVLDYQNWHSNVKKILPHRKHARQQKSNGGILHDQDSFETSQLSAGRRSLILQADESIKKHNSHTRSIKDCLKSLVSEETLKDGCKKRGPILQRTLSIHHLETDEWVHVHPVILNSQNDKSEEFSEKEPDKNDKNQEIEDYVDISENSKINKDKFRRILQDSSQVSPTKAKLTKAGSFPSMLGGRNLRPAKLKHKLNEFYSVPKNEKGLDNWARKLDLSKFESLICKLDQQDGKNLDDDLNNGSMKSIKRICSLNERANRYAQLFDTGDTKEATLYSFRSLKLTNHISNSDLRLTDVGNSKSNGLHNDFYALPIEEECGQQTQGIKSNSSSQEESHQLKFQISEGLKPLCVSEEGVKDNVRSINTHDHNDEYFNYVREILDRSGFLKNGFEQTWYSSNQLLNPSVFQEIESQYPYDPKCFEEELVELCYRLHRFDLVGEALLKMHERSFSYYPKALSYSCHLSPAPSGEFVLEEVWKSLSRLLNLKPDLDQSLESIMSWDLRVGDDWMNLQMESECVALELEDQIFNELLGEVFCS